MTAKQFFKGKAFKCIIVLMCILLASGILLSVCWGFLEVTDEERFARKINAMYDGETVTSVEQDISGKNLSVSGATIQSVWLIPEKNDYLVQAASRGYGGNVTCWIAVSMDETLANVTSIRKVINYSVADSAELIGNISNGVYEMFTTEYEDGKVFDYGTKGGDEYIDTGASHTMSAICNCVNGSVEFIKAYASGTEIVDPLAGFTYTEYIDGGKTSWTVDGAAVNYTVVTTPLSPAGAFTVTLTVDGDKTIKNYAIVTNGSTSDSYVASMSEKAKNLNGKSLDEVIAYLGNDGGELNTGATRSNTLCYNAAAFALGNYEKALERGNSNE